MHTWVWNSKERPGSETVSSIVSMEVKADSTEGSFHGTVQAVEKGH